MYGMIMLRDIACKLRCWKESSAILTPGSLEAVRESD